MRRLWGAVFCGYLALGASLQELPAYVIERFDTGLAAVGYAVGIAWVATALIRPFAGFAGDTGRARAVVMAGAGMTALGGLGHLLAPSVGVLFLARLIMGAGEAALFSAALPWVLAQTPAPRRGRAAGWFGLSMWGGLALGPPVAVAAHPYGATWWVVTALPLVSVALVASTPKGDPPADTSLRLRGWRVFLPRGAGLPGLCFGMCSYGYGTLTAIVVLYLTESRIGGQSVALSIFAFTFLITRVFGSPLVDQYGGTRVARVMLGFEIVGLGLLALVPLAPAALLGTALVGIGLGLMYPAVTVMTLHRTDDRTPGVAVGAMTSLWDLGIMVAGPASGLVADYFGYRTAFAVAAVVVVIALAITLGIRTARPARADVTAS